MFDLTKLEAVYGDRRGDQFKYTGVTQGHDIKQLRAGKREYRYCFVITHVPEMEVRRRNGRPAMVSTGRSKPAFGGPYVCFGNKSQPTDYAHGMKFTRFEIRW